ncbi:type VII secretion-associated serine protease mycosin [Antrihabitans sp. YC3-6]|uniref:Type VII secretion-associated serine protease mycosin n=1 Tax=Antrihabitans stalagmiti TaxID=2799499 RepID=A0A934NNU5_9NOCA|nr:type VII secretion-associated serine protease mycosin [Antrihabitans stalagmiti]MBJ8338575.1 type VII secretion-associated serine protease mycosin [Antrihabitans stalagmiti]
MSQRSTRLRRAGGPARLATVVLLVGVSQLASPAGAQAVEPPVIDPGAFVADAKVGPLDVTEKKTFCAEPVLSGGTDVSEPPPGHRLVDISAAWQFSRGAGQKVAVIDTGVNKHPRLPGLQPGGDYVASDSDGTVDCDGHGTLVAGIIAATPSPADGFSGVAPEAQILAIRQYSAAYEPKDTQKPIPGVLASAGYGNAQTMASAVVRAVELGATVINISEVACGTAGADLGDAALGAAVKFAYDRNVVVVAAAGNVDSDTACKDQNPPPLGSFAGDPDWLTVRTVATPAWFSPYVLSVASVTKDGMPAPYSLSGPWVGIAAPGEDVISLDSKPGGVGLINAQQGEGGSTGPYFGTSFAAPYVSGLAALVRSRFPALDAQQVMDRITRTAHGPGAGRDNQIGAGVIDPLAALTAAIPEEPVSVGADDSLQIAAPDSGPYVDPRPRQWATIGSLICLGLLVLGVAISIPFRREGKLTEDTDY